MTAAEPQSLMFLRDENVASHCAAVSLNVPAAEQWKAGGGLQTKGTRKAVIVLEVSVLK